MKLSIVIPVYGCGSCLAPLVDRIGKSTRNIGLTEIIFVDDGSIDNGWTEIVRLASQNRMVQGIRLSRNFGQHYAITAGIDQAAGDYIVVMDCDLQDLPEEIPKLYRKVKAGFDIVYARRVGRQDSWYRKIVSLIFHRIFGFLSGMETDPAVGNFSIARKQVVEEVKKLREQNRSYLQALKWTGFSYTYLEVVHASRFSGRTAYTNLKLAAYALDSITAYSDKPLKLAVGFGFVVSVVAFILGLAVLIRAVFFGIPITGWASLFVSIYFLSGLLFIYLGVLGLYLGKLFAESRKRPLYVIAEKTSTRKGSHK